MRRIAFFILFIGCILALANSVSAQTPIDSLAGVNNQGYAYLREDLVVVCNDTVTNTINIGGSITHWKLKEAKLYVNPATPNVPGYFILNLGKKLKTGATVVMYAQISSKIWLPQSAIDAAYDIFPDDILEWNSDHTGHNFRFKVNNTMSFDFGQ